jgi:hypothetical protein
MWGSEIVSLALLAYYYYLHVMSFPQKAKKFSSLCLSEATHFLGTLKFGIRICACPPLIVFLARSTTIDSHRNPIALPSITQFFFPRSKGKCIATIRRLDPVTAPPPTSPRKACSVVPAPPKLFWEESKVAIMLSSVERWGCPGIIPPALSLTS